MTADNGPRATVQIALRISPDLRQRVKAAANANNRSVNSELTAALEELYPVPLTRDDVEHYLHEWFEGLNSQDQATVANYLLNLHNRIIADEKDR